MQVLQAPCGIEVVVLEGVGVGAVGDDGSRGTLRRRRDPRIGYLSAAELNKWTGQTIKLLTADTSEPGPGTDMAIALLAMLAQMERIYMLERAAGARAAKEAHGLPTGRPAKRDHPRRSRPADQRRCDPRTGRRRARRQPLQAVPRATQAPREDQPRRLMSDPSRIPVGQRHPLLSQRVLPGPQHLATRATSDGLWS